MGAAVAVEVVLDLEFELALAVDFGFRAQGGRSDWSWLNATPAKSSAGMVSSKEKGCKDPREGAARLRRRALQVTCGQVRFLGEMRVIDIGS